jgi:hypothetical protein
VIDMIGAIERRARAGSVCRVRVIFRHGD